MRFIGCYPTPLLARPLFDRYEQTGDLHFLQKAYGASLAVWSCVDPSGKGYNGREWRFNPPEKGSPEYNYYRNGCFSGEVGMGLYGNLSMLKSYLVRDPDFGLVGYGCAVAETVDDYTLTPQDGLGVRAAFMPLGVALETVKACIERATLTKDLRRLELVLSKPSEHAKCARISIRGMASGSYQCSTGHVETGAQLEWIVPYCEGQESLNLTLSC